MKNLYDKDLVVCTIADLAFVGIKSKEIVKIDVEPLIMAVKDKNSNRS